MYFEINGLKSIQIGEEIKQEKINMIFEGENDLQIRDILKYLGIVTLSIKPYNNEISVFGKIFFKFTIKDINSGGIIKNGVLPSNTIKEGYFYLHENLGIDLSYINDLEKPIDEEKIKSALEKLKEYSKNTKSDEKEKNKNKEQRLDDKKLQELKEFISLTLVEAENLIEKVQGKISPINLKRSRDTIDELKKLRMGSNVEKISLLFEDLIKIMEYMELEYIEKLKLEDLNTQKNSMVSDLDIVMEYNKYNKAQKVSKASKISKINMRGSDLYYSIMGKPGIYIKLLIIDTIKNISIKLQSLDNTLYSITKYIEIFVIFLILELNIYYIYNLLIGNQLSSYYQYIRPLGLFGFIIYIINKIITKNAKVIIAMYLIGIILFFILNYFIWSNFGL